MKKKLLYSLHLTRKRRLQKNSPDAVLGNRFIKIMWAIGENAPSPFVPEVFSLGYTY